MPLTEADTRAKLIDPAIHKCGWTEDLIRREETAGTVEIINGKARRRSRGKIDYVLRVKVNVDTQPVALALKAFQNVFGADAAEVYRKPDGTNNAKNARIHIATYQTLGIENENGDANFLTTHYPRDYFTYIVIDECHRSAWGKWSQVLTRNRSAVHIGLTATPRQLVESLRRQTEKSETDSLDQLPLAAEREAIIKQIRPIDLRAPYGVTREVWADAEITANNLTYFGEPTYEYDIAQAIEDGYLAACEIQKGRVNLDDAGITKEEIIARNPVDAITGPSPPNRLKISTREPNTKTAFSCPTASWPCAGICSTICFRPVIPRRRPSSSAPATAMPTTWPSA